MQNPNSMMLPTISMGSLYEKSRPEAAEEKKQANGDYGNASGEGTKPNTGERLNPKKPDARRGLQTVDLEHQISATADLLKQAETAIEASTAKVAARGKKGLSLGQILAREVGGAIIKK